MTKENKRNKNNKSNKNNKKEKFDTLSGASRSVAAGVAGATGTSAGTAADTPSTYQDVIAFLSVSPTAGDNPTTFSEKVQDYFILLAKYGFLVVLLSLNFLGLSVSLNCNADQEYTMRIISAIFAFFFGFVYLIVNYYTYKVLGEGKICKMNKDKLFPFKT